MPPAMPCCLVMTEAAAEASLEPTAMPTSAAARAAKSLMPSPQYIATLPNPCSYQIRVFGLRSLPPPPLILHLDANNAAARCRTSRLKIQLYSQMLALIGWHAAVRQIQMTDTSCQETAVWHWAGHDLTVHTLCYAFHQIQPGCCQHTGTDA